jgi:hypothetical protein
VSGLRLKDACVECPLLGFFAHAMRYLSLKSRIGALIVPCLPMSIEIAKLFAFWASG